MTAICLGDASRGIDLIFCLSEAATRCEAAIILQREGVKRTLFAIHVSGWVFQPKPQDKNPSALQPVKFDKVSLTVPAQGTR